MENPEKFIQKKYWSSEEFREATIKAAKRTEIRKGKRIPNQPEALVENYLHRFTDILKRQDKAEREQGIEAIRRLLYREYIIKPENISNDYIDEALLGNFAEHKGYNYSDFKNPDIKQRLV